ncbi:MAG: NUDIX domain-containing protein, partial [Thiotrichales bacterium]|nr:NUDIX domain-containing protein [Thiotrichales bacterium]
LCAVCPIGTDCVARREGTQARIPGPRPGRAVPCRATKFRGRRARDGALLLERRPPSGIWGGLWCFPECDAASDIAATCRARYGIQPVAVSALTPIAHGFTHFKLDVHPVLVEIGGDGEAAVADPGAARWFPPGAAASIGLAAPVKRLIEELANAVHRRTATRESI